MAKKGDFNGVGSDGSIQGLLFPASVVFSPNKSRLYITNLALYLPFAGVPGGDAFRIRGLVYLKLKKLDLALTDYDSALQANPKNAFSLYGRGIAKRWNGDEAGAIADISAAEQIMPDIAADFGRYGVSAP